MADILHAALVVGAIAAEGIILGFLTDALLRAIVGTHRGDIGE